ncbi:MAG: hypothetical protein ACFBSE_16230 [Prochloraceae cyanobacterium]
MVKLYNEYPEPNQNYISEISLLQFNNENFECLELTLNCKSEKEQGNRTSYYLNRYLSPPSCDYLSRRIVLCFTFSGTLEDYYNSKIKEKNVEEIITNLEVKDLDGSSNAKTVGFRQTVGERREELLKKSN